MLMIERQNSTLWTSWGIGTALWTEKEATEVNGTSSFQSSCFQFTNGAPTNKLQFLQRTNNCQPKELKWLHNQTPQTHTDAHVHKQLARHNNKGSSKIHNPPACAATTE
jgi:hypothetical protein